MKCRITILIKAVVVIGLALSFLFFPGRMSLHAAEPIKIGAVLCVTGWAGALGTPEMEVVRLYEEKLNREGGILGRPIEVYLEDDQSNPTNAAIAATKLIRDKKVCVVIGSSVTNNCMSMIPIFEREQVLNVALGAGHEITDPLKKWVFRVPLTDIRLTPIMLKCAAQDLGARKIALLHSTDAAGMMGPEALKRIRRSTVSKLLSPNNSTPRTLI